MPYIQWWPGIATEFDKCGKNPNVAWFNGPRSRSLGARLAYAVCLIFERLVAACRNKDIWRT